MILKIRKITRRIPYKPINTVFRHCRVKLKVVKFERGDCKKCHYYGKCDSFKHANCTNAIRADYHSIYYLKID